MDMTKIEESLDRIEKRMIVIEQRQIELIDLVKKLSEQTTAQLYQ